MHGAMFVCLLVFLASCATNNERIVKLSPPEVYLQEVHVEKCNFEKNDDLFKCYLSTKKALKRANDDKRKIVEWVKQ